MNWQNMPGHLYKNIFKHLDLKSNIISSEVCREWYEAVYRDKSVYEKTSFAITQHLGSERFAVVDPATVKNMFRDYQHVVVRGFVIEEWSQEKFKQMCNVFESMIQQCSVIGFTLEVAVGSRFLREFLLANEHHLKNIQDFTLRIREQFCDSNSYNFPIDLPELRRIRVLQAPMIDLTSKQTIQVNSMKLEEITLCSNSSLGIIFNNPQAHLKQLHIFVHSYRTRMIQEVISILEFKLETLVIDCTMAEPWLDYLIYYLIPLLGPIRLIINQRESMTVGETKMIVKLFKEATVGLEELVLTTNNKGVCDCGHML